MNIVNEPLAIAAVRLQIAILAAGFSRRLGRPKALARIHGRSLLRRTLSVVSRVARSKIVIVVPPQYVRYRRESRGFNVAFSVNPRRAGGLSSSVRRSIEHARYCSGVLLLPVDLAALRVRDLDKLVTRWRGAPRRVIARRIGQDGESPKGGVPLILPRWLFGRALEVTGDTGLRDLVNRLPPGQRLLVELPSAAFDIDTSQDLHAARRRLRPARFAA
jgi:molybdenum cofactor cytidylyltransferase